MYCVVLLQNRKTVVVPEEWVQHKSRKRTTKIFQSVDESKIPDFSLSTKYFIQKCDACYYGYYIEKYRKYYLQA